jgi:hypothetical protein
MPTMNDLINASYQDSWSNAQACQEYEDWLDAEDARRKYLQEERRRVFLLWTRSQEEIEADPDYDEDF